MTTIGLGVHYTHPEHGIREVALSQHTQKTLQMAYAPEPLLKPLRRHRVNARPLREAVTWLQQQMTKGWILGCSGFATAMSSDDYSIDRAVLRQLYAYLKHKNALPILTTDGGTGVGALQANADIASQFRVPTLGCTPISALAKDHVGPRQRTIIGGANYKERERLVGALPDILLCLDGKDGTLREAEMAASCGSIVVLVSLRSYEGGPIDTHLRMKHLRRAVMQGRVVTCRLRRGEDVVEAFEVALKLREWIGSTGSDRLRKIEECILS
ncbi:MAG TPA: hypothetical protein VD907_06110 [Verrucomicrobiae bacterium]|nr:hypothetical protein [Verrucomicrobiae bacterium]